MPSPHSSARDPGRRPRDRRQPRQRADRDRHRERRCRPTTTRSAASSGRRRASPPRTCRRGSAATWLMAISNARGWLVLTTGNKSRDVGRLRDALRRHGGRLRGDQGRAEDARLRARALSQRALPRAADPGGRARARAVGRAAPRAARRGLAAAVRGARPILEAYVERDLSRDQIIEMGADPSLVEEVVAMVDRSEYKRRQAPPGIRITPRAFGRDRRLPITNRFGG